ncbi:uncharacterized protein LOC133531513 isoform X3 [Cydia pomonella]|uniref:uncharacterized protein LOC133531513 isoform X3 n=1 Tax=Cydia pomonella TaxID=82600 RepID=UPI002ADE0E04|nr:uncharacterized protein LOC133531513 isoform X3 [Cydia pomonella]
MTSKLKFKRKKFYTFGEMDFDTEGFIMEVQNRPAIWNTKCVEYNDRELRLQAWNELVDMYGGDEEMTRAERKQLGGESGKPLFGRDLRSWNKQAVSRSYIRRDSISPYNAYHDNPCLWDITSELYKNKEMKQTAWGELTKILKKLDEDANVSSAKKKVDNLRSAYFREVRKVRASKLKARDEKDVFHPNLWYYKLMCFLGPSSRSSQQPMSYTSDPLECDNKQDSSSDEELIETPATRRKPSHSQGIARKKRRAISISRTQTFVEPLQYCEPKYPESVKNLEQKTKEPNYFGVYVGEQLEQVSKFQRTVAEKLISEVLFLAKTENLSYDSKIETSSKRDSSDGLEPEYVMISSPRMVEEQEEKDSCESTLLKELLTVGKK